MTKGVVCRRAAANISRKRRATPCPLKLFGRETGQSVTLFEQAVPAWLEEQLAPSAS